MGRISKAGPDQFIWKTALKQAARSAMHDKVGAVIATSSGQVLTTGYNRMLTQDELGPRDRRNDFRALPFLYSLHAERDALIKLASKRWKKNEDLQLFVVRRGKRNHWKLSRPCSGCWFLIGREGRPSGLPLKTSRIVRVFYSVGTDDDGHELVGVEDI